MGQGKVKVSKEEGKWNLKLTQEETTQTKVIWSSKLAMCKILQGIKTEREIYWSDVYTKARNNSEAKNHRHAMQPKIPINQMACC